MSMINQKIRYSVIYNYIKKLGGNNCSICEVGSGNFGMGRFIKRVPFTGVDVNFSDYSKDIKPFPKNMTPIESDVTKKLPFPKNCYNLVVSMDVFEHLPKKKRKHYLEELLRISKGVVIVGFPCGRKSLESDLKQRKFIRFFKRNVPMWLEEHVTGEYPCENELDNVLIKQRLEYISFGNESIFIHNIIQYFEMLSKGTSLFDFLLPMTFLERLSKIGRYFYRKVYIINKER